MADSREYPRATPGSRFHQWPSGGIWFYSRLGQEGLTILEVNETGSEILIEADGLTSIAGIVERIEARYPESDDVGKFTRAFLANAIQREVLEVSDVPGEGKPRLTGRKEYFAPVHVMLELTRRCNLRCQHCYNRSGEGSRDDMPAPWVQELLRRFSAEGAEVVELTGGEPMMHPDFFQVFETAAGDFEKVGLLSNGWFINETAAERLKPFSQNLLVQIDLDGSSAEPHDRLRGVPGAWERAKRAIELLSERDIRVRVAMSVTSFNIHELKETMVLARDLGARVFSSSLVLPIGRATGMDSSVDDEQIRSFIEAIRWGRDTFPGLIKERTEADLERGRNLRNCGAGYRSCLVRPTGEVVPCPLMSDYGMVIGNLLEEGFESVFGSDITRFFHALEKPGNQVCEGCDAAVKCGGCLLEGFLQWGDIGNRCLWAKRQGLESRMDLIEADKGDPACILPARREYVFSDCH